MVKDIIICLYFIKIAGFGTLKNLFGGWSRKLRGVSEVQVRLCGAAYLRHRIGSTHRPTALDGLIMSDIPCKSHQNWYLRLLKSLRGRLSS